VLGRGLALSFAAVILASCAAPTPPPDSPTAVQIAAARDAVTQTGLDPVDYASVGITLAQHNCAQWFSQQVMNAQATGFGAQGLALLGGVAGATGTPEGAIAAAGASALSAALGAAQSSFGAGASPAATWGLISRIQAAWLAAMPTPLTTADAYALVEAFAEQCSLPAIQRAVIEAMSAVPVVATVATPTSAPQELTPPGSSTASPAQGGRTPMRRTRQAISGSSECYMTVMGCRVAIPQVTIGGR
jgi:hypothetical protein